MQLIRTGFDGLDISYKLTISEELADELEEQRTVAAAGDNFLGLIRRNGVTFIVHATGALGGYAFRCDTGLGGPFGENWFFKRPNGRADEWGVRVSCRALPLALYGLTKTRQKIEETLSNLGLEYQPGMESIGRVDVACDILAPDLAPDRVHFISHARSTVKEISDAMVQVVGRSGRVESVTIGKNPNRQVILYDKRAEVLATGKGYWWPIWDDALAALGLPRLDLSNRAASAVWRVEIRAFKRHLKDTWGVTTWGDLREKLPAILGRAIDDVRYTMPTTDTNRARWPVHPLWAMVVEALTEDMQDLASMVDPASIEALLREERDDMLRKQIAGCMVSRAALNGVPEHRLSAHAMDCADQISREWQRNQDKTRERLAQARVKYGVGVV